MFRMPLMRLLTTCIPCQESELPEVTDLLRPYVQANITASIASPSTSTASYIVRAVNYDGRPVILKRKVKKTSTASVCFLLRFDLTRSDSPCSSLAQDLLQAMMVHIDLISCSRPRYTGCWINCLPKKLFACLARTLFQ